ncbi:MAG: hypothetical protein HYR85_15775 [Planctomycetes bacterium]|nr:hypothetical protein [Planctomycetota bacterium]MBI3848110.1 hypothetical protein [Planctomycetota bacterium]
MKDKSPEQQLAGFIVKFTPDVGVQARAALVKLRKRLPGAIEMVYDNYNALAIGFGPSERASEAILSIAVFPRWVTLCFLQGAGLPDPAKRLRGAGTRVRHIRLDGPHTLDEPEVQALIGHALKRAKKPLDRNESHRIIIKSVSEKQRPRRPA